VAVVSAVLATVALGLSHRAAFAYSTMRLTVDFPSLIVNGAPTREELVEAHESARSFARLWRASAVVFVVVLGLSLWSARADVRRWPWFSGACLGLGLGIVYRAIVWAGAPTNELRLFVALGCTTGAAFELWRVRKDARRSSAVRWGALVVGLGAMAMCAAALG
jgi:hypothetical protein